MYERFYGLRENPFSILPDPAFLYLGRRHRLALNLLEYGLMNQAGFNVITGQVGTGKTTLIRHLLTQLGPETNVGLISNTHQSLGELLQWVLFAFELESREDGRAGDKVEMFRRFLDFLIHEHARNKRTVLIVDEAQNMSADSLEELRMLSNVNADKHLLLQIVLAGQAGLRDTLRRPDMEQFAQRVAVDYHLEPLSLEETHCYIRHRLAVGGVSDPDLFDVPARDAVHCHSGGVPRIINLLCDTALVYGYAEQKPRIDEGLVNDVAEDKRRGGIFRDRSAVAG
jgi:general secretion pathway protein A